MHVIKKMYSIPANTHFENYRGAVKKVEFYEEI